MGHSTRSAAAGQANMTTRLPGAPGGPRWRPRRALPPPTASRRGTPSAGGASGATTPASAAAKALRVPLQQQLAFERRGFCVLRGLMPPSEVAALRTEMEDVVSQGRLQALQQRVRVLCPGVDPSSANSPAAAVKLLSQHSTEQVGFLQFFNSWRTRTCVRRLVLSNTLADAAAQLLGVQRVRLYQDCVFLKDPGFGETNWHSDLRMAPLDTNAFVTAWVPLRPVTGGEREGDSGLLFAAGSHRDFALPFWYDLTNRSLDDRAYKLQSTGAMALGDVSFHHGWTLHCAAPQPPGTTQRLALAVSFFADGARLLPKAGGRSAAARSLRPGQLHNEDAESYREWMTQVKAGALAAHPLLPLAWPPEVAAGADAAPGSVR